MKSANCVAHITSAEGNVFGDLGFGEDEAFDLQAWSKSIIDGKLAIKIFLIDALCAWIKRAELKQADAAVILGVSRRRVSDIVKKNTQEFTIEALVDMAMRSDHKVHIQISELPPRRKMF
ncbi:helix-turn-helix domain-containing protein [Celeribacter halophilus]|uniref:helix-turn-helix domain-containing protein n=1 Tax=Celeribacter halophilus TaxID=576117 RepID=UPI003A933C6C